MLGRKTFEPKLVSQFSLEERVPEDHLLRRVAAVVDFSFVRWLTARFYSHTGPPGIDPVVLFKMALRGWLYGITSERRLADDVRLNLAFMWFLGYDLDERPPDHSVLSKARARCGVTVYQAVFREIVRQCEQVGLVRSDQLFLDSTLVAANASLDSMGARALVAQLAGVDDHLAAVWRDTPAAPTEEPPRALPPAVGDVPTLPSSAGPRALRVTDPGNASLGPLNARLVSRTDPDAALVSRRDKIPPGLSYKAHVGVDGGAARLITAVEVTAGEVGDEQLVRRLICEHVGSTGRTVTEVVAATKYGTQANYVALETAQIRASIPPCPGGGIRRALRREHFVYDPATDCYRCPTGQPLRRMGRTRTGTPLGGIQYRADPPAGRACPRKSDCCGTAAARTSTRPDAAGLSERVRAYLATRQARQRLRRRGCWVETATAALKEHHGLRRAHYRGRAQVQMQAYGAAIAYNVKKLVARIRSRPVGAVGALHFRPGYRIGAACPAARARYRSTSHHFGNRPRGDQ